MVAVAARAVLRAGVGVEAGLGCGEQCANRKTQWLCDPKFCPCGEQCSNKPFHMLKAPKLEAFLTDNK